MKIALELQPCCGNRSGIGIYTYELAKRLKNQNGVEFCGNLFNFLGRNDNTASLQGIDMPVYERRMLPYGLYRRIWNCFPIFYQSLFPQNADLNIFFNYIIPPRVDGKVITTIYDMTYLRYPETMNRKNLHRIEKGICYSVERSDHIMTISKFSKMEIVQLLGIPEDKVSIVYSAPAYSREVAKFEETAKKFGIFQPYILYIGTIEPRKNLVRLIKAFEQLKGKYKIPHQLVLAGGNGWQCEEIYQTAHKVSCADEVVFTGYLSEPEKNALYKNACLFVFPSLYEGFGMPPLEAMGMGCPVVCSNTASLPEIVENAAKLVNPWDEMSIAEGILNVLSDEEFSANLIKKGYDQKNKFTWDISTQRLIEICKMVVEE